MNNHRTHDELAQDLNRAANNRLARMTGGLSPVSVAVALTDQMTFLAISAGKSEELGSKAHGQWVRLSRQALKNSDGQASPCTDPLPQDRRFATAQWPVIDKTTLLEPYAVDFDVPGVFNRPVTASRSSPDTVFREH